MRALVRWGIIVVVCAFGVSGCGVRGSLEAPPEAKADKTATAESGQGKPEGATGKPHKDFILDGLIR
jgi:predicted small lipoprotein YifL